MRHFRFSLHRNIYAHPFMSICTARVLGVLQDLLLHAPLICDLTKPLLILWPWIVYRLVSRLSVGCGATPRSRRQNVQYLRLSSARRYVIISLTGPPACPGIEGT